MGGETTTLTRAMVSALVVAVAVGIVIWVWPDDGSWLQAGLVVLSVMVSIAVLISLWKK